MIVKKFIIAVLVSMPLFVSAMEHSPLQEEKASSAHVVDKIILQIRNDTNRTFQLKDRKSLPIGEHKIKGYDLPIIAQIDPQKMEKINLNLTEMQERPRGYEAEYTLFDDDDNYYNIEIEERIAHRFNRQANISRGVITVNMYKQNLSPLETPLPINLIGKDKLSFTKDKEGSIELIIEINLDGDDNLENSTIDITATGTDITNLRV